jgi:hypothetical protein
MMFFCIFATMNLDSQKHHLNDKIELDFCEIFLREDQILQINIFPHSFIGENEAKKMTDTSLKLTRNVMFPVMIVVGEFADFDKSSREYSADPEKEVASSATAYLLNNLGHIIIGNFYLKVNKPTKPVRLFENEQDAIKWLKNFVLTNK